MEHYWFSSILTSSKQRTDINWNLIPQMLLQKDIITNLTFPDVDVTQPTTSNCCLEPWQKNSSQTYALIGPAGHNFNRFCDVEEYRAKFTKAAQYWQKEKDDISFFSASNRLLLFWFYNELWQRSNKALLCRYDWRYFPKEVGIV